MMQKLQPGALVSLLIDASCVALGLAMLIVLVVGGAALEVGPVHVRVSSLTNPTLICAVLLIGRCALLGRHPLFGFSRFSVQAAAARVARTGIRIFEAPRIDGSVVLWTLITLVAAAVAVKLAAAWWLPGFYSGDDVEIHEMTLSTLYGLDLPVWNLRNAFFPLAFVFPAQYAVHALGIDDPRVLVFSGRSAVALLSSLTIVLTWLAVARLLPGAPMVALAAAALVTVNKLQMAFGSTELPRPVAGVLVLGAFVLLLWSRRRLHFLGGCLLGAAAAFRFSEIVFVAPALGMVAANRMWTSAGLMLAGVAAAAAAAIGVSDYLYWGVPFSSAIHAVEYTLVDRQSSRGFEPFYQYARLVPLWTNWLVLVLALIGSARCLRVALWAWLPIAILSLLPHKETRYLVPVVPFVCIAAALGLRRVVEHVRLHWPARGSEAIAALALPLLLLALFQEAGGWRLRRSNDEARLGLWFRAQGRGGVAMRHVWRAGGGAYLHDNEPVIDLDDPRFATATGRVEMFKDVRWIVLDEAAAAAMSGEELRRLGFRPDRSWGSYQVYERAGR